MKLEKVEKKQAVSAPDGKMEQSAATVVEGQGIDPVRDIEAPITFNNRILTYDDMIKKAPLGALLKTYSAEYLTSYEVNNLIMGIAKPKEWVTWAIDKAALDRLSRRTFGESSYDAFEFAELKDVEESAEAHKRLPTFANIRGWTNQIALTERKYVKWFYIDSADPAWMSLSLLNIAKGGVAIHRIGRDVGGCTLEQIYRFSCAFERTELVKTTLGRIYICGIGALGNARRGKKVKDEICDLFAGFRGTVPDAPSIAHSLVEFLRRVNLDIEAYLGAPDGIDKSDIWAAIHGFRP